MPRLPATRRVPVRALALGADLRVLILVAREPFVVASVAAVSRQFDLRHNPRLHLIVYTVKVSSSGTPYSNIPI